MANKSDRSPQPSGVGEVTRTHQTIVRQFFKRTHQIVIQRVDGKKEKMGYISLVTDMASEEIAEIIKKSIDNLVKKDE